jgi:N-carbamoyl-L-amino-acid hydrolase
MHMRVNAGLGMARIVEMVHRVAMDHQPDAVGAVGHMNVWPNSRNVIPRPLPSSPSTSAPPSRASSTPCAPASRRRPPRSLRSWALGIEIESVGHFDPVTFDPALADSVRRAADALGLLAPRHRLGRGA